MVADTGNPKWDKFSRPRTVIVDSTNTLQPFSFGVYPSTLLYDTASSRLSDPHPVDLGHGMTGDMYSVIDDQLLVTWNLLVFHWRNKGSAQRVLIGAVDNHEADAPFPEPNGALWPTLGTLFTVLFRGNAVTTNREPEFKDAEMLTQFGRGLVTAQLAMRSPSRDRPDRRRPRRRHRRGEAVRRCTAPSTVCARTTRCVRRRTR